MKNTEIAEKKEAPLLATHTGESFGESLDSTDLERDNIVLCQKLTPLLEDPNCSAVAGDYVRTDTLETVGGSEKGVELIPITVYKTWRMRGEEGENYGSEPFVAGDTRWKEEGTTDDGQPYTLQLQYNFIVLLRADSFALPFVMCVRSTSIPAAKRINSICQSLIARGGNSFDQAIEVYSVAIKDGNKSWFASRAKAAGETTAEERKLAAGWKDTLAKSAAKITSKEEAVDDDSEIPF